MIIWLTSLCVMATFGMCAGTSFGDNLHHNPPKSKWVGRKTLTWLDANNEIRYVDVYVPKRFKKSKERIPVVMWFTGYRGHVNKDFHYLGMTYEDSGIEPYAEKNGFMLVVIDEKHVGDCAWEMLTPDGIDEPLILDVLAYLKETFPVDETRVYLWGISLGGKLSQVMAAKYSKLFAAVVSFSGVIDEIGSQYDKDFSACVKASARKFPIQHWQTEGDLPHLIKNMPHMLRLYRENGYKVEFVWLDHLPGRELKHEWYPDLYNQRMWDWCKQFKVESE